MKNYHLGMRAVKTALAVMLSLMVCSALDKAGMLYAAIAATICMQQTTEETFKAGGQRLLSTTVGSLTALVILTISIFIPYYREFAYLIVIPLGSLLTIYILSIFKKYDAIALAVVVFLCITIELDYTAVDYSVAVFTRYFGTVIGIAASVLVNKLIRPLKAE